MEITQTSEDNSTIYFSVSKPKTYTTHERACRYGQVRDAAPIEMLDGSQRWIASPFYGASGKIKIYKEVI